VVDSEIRGHETFWVNKARIHHAQAQLRGVQTRTTTLALGTNDVPGGHTFFAALTSIL
jgi:hypothetical protein